MSATDDFALIADLLFGQEGFIDSDSQPPAPSYGTGAIKRRRRRTKAEINNIKDAIVAIVQRDKPMTVRQVFYRLVTTGLIDKTEAEYKGTVARLLKDLRAELVIPYSWISDNTRWMRKPATYDSLEELLTITSQTYRRSLWSGSDVYVEVWLEKDALAGVLFDVTAEYDVPLMVTKGYPSLTFLHSAGEQLRSTDKRNIIYYFGDWDPSGVDISRNVEERLREFAGSKTHLEFTRSAVTLEQIADWNLPTRPTKKKDVRSKGWIGGSVEVDALPPDDLRQICRRQIEQHIDQRTLDLLRTVEAEERRFLLALAREVDK